jgi:hypothetical protein
MKLRLQLSNASMKRRDGLLHVIRTEALGDVLRAVPIVADEADAEETLDFSQLRRRHELSCQSCRSRFTNIHHTGMAEQPQPLAVSVIHEEETHAIIAS